MTVQKFTTKGVTAYHVSRRYSNGMWETSGPFTNIKEAAIEDERLRLKPDVYEKNTLRFETVGVFFKHWQRHNRDGVSEGWRISQDQMWRDYCAAFLSELRVVDVSESDINQIISSARLLGRSSATMVQIYLLLSKVFNDAKDIYRLIQASPVKHQFHKPKITRTQPKFLLPEEVELVIYAVKGTWAELFFLLGFYTGMRVGEIQALTWADIDFTRNVIYKRRSFNRKIKKIQLHPKEKDHSTIPIPSRLTEILKRLKGPAKQFVCLNPRGLMVKHTAALLHLRRVCDLAGVKQITLHEMRHSASELYVSKGASTEDVRRLLGHHSTTTTQRYLHSHNIERLKTIADKT